MREEDKHYKEFEFKRIKVEKFTESYCKTEQREHQQTGI